MKSINRRPSKKKDSITQPLLKILKYHDRFNEGEIPKTQFKEIFKQYLPELSIEEVSLIISIGRVLIK